MAKFFLGINQANGIIEAIYTFFDEATGTFSPDITVGVQADALGFPSPAYGVVWGCGDGTFGRVGTYGINGTFLALGPSSSLRIDTLPSSQLLRRWPVGYLGNKALFVDNSNWAGHRGEFQFFDTDTLLWEPKIPAPQPEINPYPVFYGQPIQVSPDGKIWGLGYTSNFPTLQSWNGAAWTDHGLIPESTFAGAGTARIFALANDAIYCVATQGEGWPGFGSTHLNFAIHKWDGVNGGWTAIINATSPTDLQAQGSYEGYVTNGAIYAFGDHTMAMWNIATRRLQLLDLKSPNTRLGITTTPNVAANPGVGISRIVGGAKESFMLLRGSTNPSGGHFHVKFSQALLDSQGEDWSLVGARSNGAGTFTDLDDLEIDVGPWWNRNGGGGTVGGFTPFGIQIVDVAPTITLVSHTVGDAVDKFGPVVIDVVGESTPTTLAVVALADITISVKIGDTYIAVLNGAKAWFAEGWKGSQIEDVALGFRISLVPDSTTTWRDGEAIDIHVAAATTVPASAAFDLVGPVRPYATTVNRMIFSALRDTDEDA